MDTIWKQKFLEIWLKDGDRKTKFFHLLTIIRRRQNSINAIRSDLGDWIIKKKKKKKKRKLAHILGINSKLSFQKKKCHAPMTLVITCALLSHKRRTQIFARSQQLRILKELFLNCKISRPRDLTAFPHYSINNIGQLWGIMSPKLYKISLWREKCSRRLTTPSLF
jgi:hypothetical protein